MTERSRTVGSELDVATSGSEAIDDDRSLVEGRHRRRRTARPARTEAAARRARAGDAAASQRRLRRQRRRSPPTRVTRLTIDDFARQLRAREISAVEVTRRVPAAHRGRQPATERVHPRHGRRGAAPGATRPIASSPPGDDRGPLHGVPISIKDLLRRHAARRRPPRRACATVTSPTHDATVDHTAATRRRGPHRQDQPSRVRVRHDERGLGIRAGPKPARSDAVARRIERRIGRQPGRRHGARDARHRHRRIDSHSRRRLRHRRPQADATASCRPTASSRSRERSITSVRSTHDRHRRVARVSRAAGRHAPAAARRRRRSTSLRSGRAAPVLLRSARRRRAARVRGVGRRASRRRRDDRRRRDPATRGSSRRSTCTSSSATPRRITRPRSRRCPSATRRRSGCGSRWRATCSPKTTCARSTGREVLRREVDAALSGYDALLLPTVPIPAPPIGASTVEINGSKEPVRNVMLRLTQLFNLTGHPAISLPCGKTSAGLPCGLQLVGTRRQTDPLLHVAAESSARAIVCPA